MCIMSVFARLGVIVAPPKLGFFLKEISAIVRAICRAKRKLAATRIAILFCNAAEATLLRSQRLGLGRGEPVSHRQFHLPLISSSGPFVLSFGPRGRRKATRRCEKKFGEEKRSGVTWGWAGRVSLWTCHELVFVRPKSPRFDYLKPGRVRHVFYPADAWQKQKKNSYDNGGRQVGDFYSSEMPLDSLCT